MFGHSRIAVAQEETERRGKRLAELLTLLIKEYEEKRFAAQHSAAPIDILRHLMKANGLRQVDLLDVFGTASVASEVLSGKRDLSKAHISRLGQQFQVSAALFSELQFSRLTESSQLICAMDRHIRQ